MKKVDYSLVISGKNMYLKLKNFKLVQPFSKASTWSIPGSPFFKDSYNYVSILPHPPSHPVSKHKHFARPTHPPFWLRNTWMVPYHTFSFEQLYKSQVKTTIWKTVVILFDENDFCFSNFQSKEYTNPERTWTHCEVQLCSDIMQSFCWFDKSSSWKTPGRCWASLWSNESSFC